MNKYEDLKIKHFFTVDGIVELFESKSPQVKVIKAIIKFMNKIIIISIIYLVFILMLRKNLILSVACSSIISVEIILYIFKTTGKISYQYSKELGGKPYELLTKNNNIYDIIENNAKLMQKEEIKILKKILKVNKMNHIQCIREIKDHLALNRKKGELIEDKDFIKNIISAYLIPIIFGIIDIYIGIFNNLDITQNLINIIYIIVTAIMALGIVVIIYKIYKVKKMSVTTVYTYPKLIKILTELAIQIEKQPKITEEI